MNTGLLEPGMIELYIAVLIAMGGLAVCAMVSVVIVGAWTDRKNRKASN